MIYHFNMNKGKVKFYDNTRGFGFITTQEGDIFFHATGVKGQVNTADDVTFETSQNKKGIIAINVKKS